VPEVAPGRAAAASGTLPSVDTLAGSVDRIAAETSFSGVVRVDSGNRVAFANAYGLAHRGFEVANTADCRFGIASGTKGLTALTIVSIIEEGLLDLATTARSVLGEDLPLVADDVTIEQLLAHRSGIGDYVDEDAHHDVTDYVLTLPVHELASTEQYLQVLDGHVARSAPGERFSYCNSGYVVLALIAERTTRTPFQKLVTQRVCAPAGMRNTAFLRSDELPGGTAVGYLAADGWRTNVLHLPVQGSGDGGIYSTAADIHALWAAFFAGRLVSTDWVAEMVRPRGGVPSESLRYGLGFWLHASNGAVELHGSDAGVSFRSVHDPSTGSTHTVLSNTSRGAWPISRRLDELLRI
jgi:CubicO group peptidase (beta-lactamase class C family)